MECLRIVRVINACFAIQAWCCLFPPSCRFTPSALSGGILALRSLLLVELLVDLLPAIIAILGCPWKTSSTNFICRSFNFISVLRGVQELNRLCHVLFVVEGDLISLLDVAQGSHPSASTPFSPLRSGPNAPSKPSRQKQIPRSLSELGQVLQWIQ